MTEHNHSPSRDEVLVAFHDAFARPTADNIEEWTRRYPQFAGDIRDHAEIKCDWTESPESEFLHIDDTLLAQGRSRALNILHDLGKSANTVATMSNMTWPQLLLSTNKTIPTLAREINIDRFILAELNAGRMRLPVGDRLMEALTIALKAPVATLQNALKILISTPPRLGHAKADKQFTITPRSYEEIIRASQMSAEQKHFWLGM